MSGLFWLLWLTCLAGCATTVPVSGLRPEYPEARYKFFGPEVAWINVNSLQPTLRWEAFPRQQDREADKKGVIGRIRHVTYDLKIWRVEEEYPLEYPARLVYFRRGLPEPWHKIEDPLEPSTKYFWSIRARFELEGHPRVTQWGVTENPHNPTVTRLPLVPNPFHYRFETPSE